MNNAESASLRLRASTPAVVRAEARGWSYFDGPSGTQMIGAAIDAFSDLSRCGLSNRHGYSPAGEETEAIMAAARAQLRDMFNAHGYLVAFGQNMTSLALALAHAGARRRGSGAATVVVTELEHAANDDTWSGPFTHAGGQTVAVPVDTGSLDIEPGAFERVAADDVAVVAVTGAANAVGVRPDLAAAHEFARATGALFVVDGVHLTPHGPPDLAALDPDVYLCSAYKFYGPHVGVALVKEAVADELQPFKVAPAPDAGPEKFETGSQNHEGIAALSATICALGELVGDGSGRGAAGALRLLAEHEAALTRSLVAQLRDTPGVRVFGHADPPTHHVATIAMRVERSAPAEVASRLAERGVFVTAGDFYATRLARRLGVAGSGGWVRVGLSGYTTAGDLEHLVAALRDVTR